MQTKCFLSKMKDRKFGSSGGRLKGKDEGG
jgi:hypothetical protein